MQQIDLEPNDYRRKATAPEAAEAPPKEGKGLFAFMFFVALAGLGWVFWNRAALTTETLFGISAMFAFCAGGLFALWLRDVH